MEERVETQSVAGSVASSKRKGMISDDNLKKICLPLCIEINDENFIVWCSMSSLYKNNLLWALNVRGKAKEGKYKHDWSYVITMELYSVIFFGLHM